MTLQRKLERLAPLSGTLFAVVLVAGLFSGGVTPGAGERPAQVVAYFASHRAEAELSSVLLALAFLLFLFFAGSLRAFMRRAEGAEALAALVLAGAVVMASGAMIASAVEYTLAHELPRLTPGTAQTLNLLSNTVGTVMLIAGGVVVALSAGLAILRGVPLSRWLGWMAIVIAVLALIVPIAFIALLLLVIWTVIVSITLFLRASSEASAAPESTPVIKPSLKGTS